MALFKEFVMYLSSLAISLTYLLLGLDSFGWMGEGVRSLTAGVITLGVLGSSLYESK